MGGTSVATDMDAQVRAQAILRSLAAPQARNAQLSDAQLAGLLAGNVDAAQLVNSIVNGAVLPGIPAPPPTGMPRQMGRWAAHHARLHADHCYAAGFVAVFTCIVSLPHVILERMGAHGHLAVREQTLHGATETRIGYFDCSQCMQREEGFLLGLSVTAACRMQAGRQPDAGQRGPVWGRWCDGQALH